MQSLIVAIAIANAIAQWEKTLTHYGKTSISCHHLAAHALLASKNHIEVLLIINTEQHIVTLFESKWNLS